MQSALKKPGDAARERHGSSHRERIGFASTTYAGGGILKQKSSAERKQLKQYSSGSSKGSGTSPDLYSDRPLFKNSIDFRESAGLQLSSPASSNSFRAVTPNLGNVLKDNRARWELTHTPVPGDKKPYSSLEELIKGQVPDDEAYDEEELASAQAFEGKPCSHFWDEHGRKKTVWHVFGLYSQRKDESKETSQKTPAKSALKRISTSSSMYNSREDVLGKPSGAKDIRPGGYISRLPHRDIANQPSRKVDPEQVATAQDAESEPNAAEKEHAGWCREVEDCVRQLNLEVSRFQLHGRSIVEAPSE